MKQVITEKNPHLTIFVVDFNKITSDAAERDRAERMAEHVKDMGARRAALVLTHTDLDVSSQGDQRAPCESQRARLIDQYARRRAAWDGVSAIPLQ